MGTYCEAHLLTAVRSCIPKAQNGAVTVQEWVKGPGLPHGMDTEPVKCTYCGARPAFVVSYYSK